jgi:uncharacterized phiE125 gp8 family phage protein
MSDWQEYNLTRTIDAAFEPVTMSEARLHLRVCDGTTTSLDVGGVAVDAGGGVVTLPAASHGLSQSGGTSIVVSGTDSYDGKYVTTSATTADVIAIPATYVAETFDGSETVNSGGSDDKYIYDLINTSRVYCEKWQNRAYISQTLEMRMDCFPRHGGVIQLPRANALSVSSISYVDSNGDDQTLSTDIYDVDIYSKPARITESYGQVWPNTRRVVNAVTVTYVAGYGTTREDVPGTIKAAMKLLMAHWFENREEVVLLNTIAQELPMAAKALLNMDGVAQ